MVTKEVLIPRIQSYLCTQVETLSVNNPMVSVFKPLITRALNKKMKDVGKFIDLVSDESGNLDVEEILDEMITSVMKTNEFQVHAGFAGDVKIGGGKIQFDLPFVNKKVVLDRGDFDNLRNFLTNKSIE